MAVMISVSILDSADAPTAEMLAMDDGRQFISLRFGPDATVMLPGFDAVSAAYARAIAAALTDAADMIDAASTIEVVTPFSDVADKEIA